MEAVDQSGDMKQWEDAEDLTMIGGRDLLDLEALGDYVLVGNLDLVGENVVLEK